MSQFRFVLVIFFFTAVLILDVYLRGTNDRIFYEHSQREAQERQLEQELVAKQLVLENLINPTALTRRLDEPQTGD